MAWRNSTYSSVRAILIGGISLCLIIALFLLSSSLPGPLRTQDLKNINPGFQVATDFQHHLCVIVPFRERFEELLVFAPFIHRFLNHKKVNHDILIVNQVDKYRFNRASLINVGFLYGTSQMSEHANNSKCDYIAMHDVDLLPLNNDLPYEFPRPPESVMHVAAPGLHPKYNYPTFIGGILIVPVPVFKSINGMSNIYWGWGLEDDEFYVRLKQSKIPVLRPTGITTGSKNTFRHKHSPKIRPRDHSKCYDQFNKTRRRDRLTGLNNVNYTLLSVSHLTIDEAPVQVLNVQLHCNTQLSPWCDCGNSTHSQSQTVKSAQINRTKKVS